MKLERVPGKTKEAKASVLRARNSRLSWAQAIRIGAAMLAAEIREQKPIQPKPIERTVNPKALNGWQPEPKEIES